MWKWLFHPFLRWINGIWIEIVFSSGKIHTLNVWNSFVSIMIFLSYYKRRKNVHEVFSSLDQFQLKFPNVAFLSALADEKYKWGFFIPGSISAEISKCSFFICFSWWKVHMRFFIPGSISAEISKCSFFVCFNWWKVHMRFFHPWINFSRNSKWGISAEIDPGNIVSYIICWWKVRVTDFKCISLFFIFYFYKVCKV